MNDSIYLGIDLGTQSVRVLAANHEGEILASASAPLISRRDGVRHEQSPEDWWNAVVLGCRKVKQVLGRRAAQIAGLAIDATSGTILLCNEQMEPITPALMYDDARASAEAEAVNAAGEVLWEQLSYRMQPSWALPKLCWLRANHQLPRNARVMHQNDFIHARLAGHTLPSDSSHSLKTGYDLLHLQWPLDIFDQLNLDARLLPEVVRPGERIGKVCAQAAEDTGLPQGTPIYAGMTDGCASQIAAGAVTPGSWNSVLGTTLVIKGATETLLHDPLGVVYSHRAPDNGWLPGGASSTGGGILSREFAGRDLSALDHAAGASAPSSIVTYPLAGRGERFPFIARDANRFTLGMPASEEEHYIAIIQGIAFIERLSYDYLQQLGAPLHGSFFFTGGVANSRECNQIRCNVLQREVSIPEVIESAFGMAVLVASRESSLREASRRMVRIREALTPDRSFFDYAGVYASFVRELASRGWLPESIAQAVVQGACA